MTDVPNDAPADEQQQQGIAQLRQRADQASKLEGENEDLRRELAFARAGIPEEGRAAKLFRDGYDGDLATAGTEWEAFKAELQGEVKPPEAPAEEQPVTTPSPADEAAAAIAASHSTLQQGGVAKPPPPPPVDKIEEGYKQFHADLARGVPRDDASVQVIGRLLEAAMVDHDPRTIIVNVPGGGQMSLAEAKNRGLVS